MSNIWEVKVARNSFYGTQIVLHFENLWLQKIHLPRKQRLWHDNLPFITNKHILSWCVSCACTDADLVNSKWTDLVNFSVFDAYLPIRLNEPKKCLYLFQRISVNRKPNKWVNRWDRIFSKICWQDFMKYIHFVALHIQNNCAKFQRILPKEYG